jgi:hypothetical protein
MNGSARFGQFDLTTRVVTIHSGSSAPDRRWATAKGYNVLNKRILLAAAVLVLSACITPLSAREWSDRFGNSTSAKFVRVHDGQVVLLRGGKVIMVPFNDLVDGDQRYVREQLEREGQVHLLPAAPRHAAAETGDDAWTEGSGEGPRLSVVERVWTDVDDRKITAGFLRTEGE